MRLLSTFLALLCTSICIAQQTNTFLLRGHVKNFSKPYFEFGTSGYFKSPRSSVIVDKKGDFSLRIFLDGLQDVSLIVNDQLLTFYASPGDTINVNWDERDFNNTLKINSPSKKRSQDLAVQLAIHKERYEPFMALQKNLYVKGTADSIRYRLINDSYNAEMRVIIKGLGLNYTNPKLMYDAYFKHASLLQNFKLLDKYKLITDDKYQNPAYAMFNERYLSDECFRLSDEYRMFLFDKVRFTNAFKYIISNEPTGVAPFNPARSDYLRGQADLNVILIRDWFLAKSVISSFESYQFNDVKAVYDDFLISGAIPAYIDTVKTFYASFIKLKPGLPAPSFSLKDDKGKIVSLSDFKGKLVYVDFWGVHCGPCIGDISENAAQVHEKYKDKGIVFLNICVDETVPAWTNKIKALKLDGVNLVAEGRTKNPVSIDYAIDGIPHYVLIDRNGNLINNNAVSLYHLVGKDKNMLDEALEAK